MSELAVPCPTECDTDCDEECHEWHEVPAKRLHAAGSCQVPGGLVLTNLGRQMTDPWTPDPRTLEWAAERIRLDRCKVDRIAMDHASGMLDNYAEARRADRLAVMLTEENDRWSRLAKEHTP